MTTSIKYTKLASKVMDVNKVITNYKSLKIGSVSY